MIRAQSAIEFVIITLFGLLVFSGAMIVAEYQFVQMSNDLVDEEAQKFLDALATEIRLAVQAGDGYIRNSTLPARFGTTPYCFILHDEAPSIRDEIELYVGNKQYFIFIPEKLDIRPGDKDILGSGFINFSNTAGKVRIQQNTYPDACPLIY